MAEFNCETFLLQVTVAPQEVSHCPPAGLPKAAFCLQDAASQEREEVPRNIRGQTEKQSEGRCS